MSQLLGDSELGALAAEYVLGTLAKDELVQAQGLLEIDEGFAAKVKFWERRLGELHLMVEAVDPDAEIWERIKGKLSDVAQNPVTQTAELPEAVEPPKADVPPLPEPAEAAPPAAPEAAVDSATAIPVPAETPVPAGTPAPAETPVPAKTPAAVAAPAPVVSSRISRTDEPSPPAAAEAPAPAAAEAPAPDVPPAPAVASPPVPAVRPAPAPASLVPPPASKPAPISAASAPFPSAPRAPLVASDEREVALRRRLRRWRAFSVLLLLLLIAVGGMVAAWRFAPEYVPPELQPIQALRVIGIKIDTGPPPRPPLPPGSDYNE
jgi:hypothetical protein